MLAGATAADDDALKVTDNGASPEVALAVISAVGEESG